ncbi:MAG: hypothetical protein ACRC2R_20775 [Xenococcaceae cyanobacterium]
MRSNLENLKISPEEIETILDLSWFDSLAIDLYRALVFRDYQNIFSLVLTNISIFILSLVLIVPINLIWLRSSVRLFNHSIGFTYLLSIAIFLVGILILIWNWFLWRKAKQYRTLAMSIAKVKKYNKLMQNLVALDEIRTVSNRDRDSNYIQNRQAIIEALQITKNSLLDALQIEKIIVNRQNFNSDRSELFAELENNLVALMSFESNLETNEYDRLINEVLEIGISVHRSLRKLPRN